MQRIYELTDHMCRHCGGRVLKDKTPGILTIDGNPIWVCSLCGEGGADMSPSIVCWCGMAFRGGELGAHMCVATKDAESDPDIELALAYSGIRRSGNGFRLQVGVVNTDQLRALRRKREGFNG